MKKFVPAYTVVILSTDNENDVFLEFAWAKYTAELPLNVYELYAIIDRSKTITYETAFNKMMTDLSAIASECTDRIIESTSNRSAEKPSVKKSNIFKRIWNKLFK